MNILLSKKSPVILLIISCILIISSCSRGSSDKNIKEEKFPLENDSVVVKEVIKEPEYIIRYRLDSLVNEKQIDSFSTRYSYEERKLIFALNRLDPTRLQLGMNLLIPDTLFDDINKYSPFPEELDILDSIPKAVLISQRIQGFALYAKGRLVKWGPVSSGKQSTPTPNGLHYGNYKAKKKISTVNPDWLLPYYFNFMNFEGVGVHQYSLPGYPASHACVRLRLEDSQFIYDWANQWELDKTGQKIERNGTPFIVFGEYDYTNPVPWQKLGRDAKSNHLTKEERETLIQYSREFMKNKKNFEDPMEQEEFLVSN
ncbi:L,D-transpeptidase [Gillisia limnaea]|uniref:ErfK/YbiS/YcfS/YnhG family protein n=1 Tax=Gillisia limnaea (strain DSM 15749 / LMG 21470 / R-8282) TaxID=865937 RepID=H2BUF7_GILLR|nr:L,D-transpeptidase [Gillisia limnaea]EHQ03835.1 ErfK/YbiS/YcfS/YnhG family protein [Gillisia limnaea DSM 15749]